MTSAKCDVSFQVTFILTLIFHNLLGEAVLSDSFMCENLFYHPLAPFMLFKWIFMLLH